MVFFKTGRAKHGDTRAYKMKRPKSLYELAKDPPGKAELIATALGAFEEAGVLRAGGNDPV
jgi:hypothetical protein